MKQGVNPTIAADEAKKRVYATGTAKAQADSLTLLEHKWVVAHPQEALTAIQWGYMTPDKAEKEFLAKFK